MLNPRNHPFCSISKIGEALAFSVDPPKILYFLCNSFSLRLTENFHKWNIFSKGVLHVLFTTFFSKMHTKRCQIKSQRSPLKKSFNIYVREKHYKQNIYMYHAVLNIVYFETFSEKHKENELHKKYTLFRGPAGSISPPTILQIKQIWWFHFIYHDYAHSFTYRFFKFLNNKHLRSK